MNNINFKYYRKKVKVTLNDGKEIIGIFEEDFEDEEKIMIGLMCISYYDIKKIELINE